jgi:hypothetical protein
MRRRPSRESRSHASKPLKLPVVTVPFDVIACPPGRSADKPRKRGLDLLDTMTDFEATRRGLGVAGPHGFEPG